MSYTKNGALSLSTCDISGEREGLMDLFYKSVRGIEKDTLNKILNKAFSEDAVSTILLSFYIRDCRGGKGERDLGRLIWEWLCSNHLELMSKLFSEIPEYGRWDDLILLSKFAEHQIYDILHKRLLDDLLLASENQPISLLAKWMPTEGHRLDKMLKFTTKYTKYHGISKQEYRTKIISPLRQYLDIVERKICSGDWKGILYNKVPSCTMYKLSEKFKKHDEKRFQEWKDGLKCGTTKVNATQLFPHEIINKYTLTKEEDVLLEAQWKELLKNYQGLFKNSLVVCDVSGSMTSKIRNTSIAPLDIAIGLGLIISQSTQEPFTNHLITFSARPEFIKIDGISLWHKIKQAKKMPWGGNTNLQSVFDIILKKVLENELTQKDLPDRLFIISDMEFDVACRDNDKSNFDVIKTKFAFNGYSLPQLIFWNVNGNDTSQYPVSVDENGTALISGFSPSILKFLLDGKDITPWSILTNTIEDARYNKLKNILV
jgi:hypothetical protein